MRVCTVNETIIICDCCWAQNNAVYLILTCVISLKCQLPGTIPEWRLHQDDVAAVKQKLNCLPVSVGLTKETLIWTIWWRVDTGLVVIHSVEERVKTSFSDCLQSVFTAWRRPSLFSLPHECQESSTKTKVINQCQHYVTIDSNCKQHSDRFWLNLLIRSWPRENMWCWSYHVE